MSNNKDFKIKGAAQINGPSKTKLGSISSGSIDVSSGDFFSEVTQSTTTFSFSNLSANRNFKLDIDAQSNGTAYDVANMNDISFLSTYGNAVDVYMRSGGRQMYVAEYAAGVRAFDLSVPYDASTATETQYYAMGWGTTGPRGLYFKPDGTAFFCSRYPTYGVYKYSLSTAWDITTASADGQYLTSASFNPAGLTFKPDGTKFYFVNYSGAYVYELSLTTAWDLSTATSLQSLDTSTLVTLSNLRGITFNGDGSKFYLTQASSSNPYVIEFNCSTNYDISSASYNSVYGTGTFQGSGYTFQGLTFDDSGKLLYVIESYYVHTYHFGTNYTITLPTVTWSNGTTPTAPSILRKASYGFSTEDGVNVVGYDLGDY